MAWKCHPSILALKAASCRPMCCNGLPQRGALTLEECLGSVTARFLVDALAVATCGGRSGVERHFPLGRGLLAVGGKARRVQVAVPE